MKTKNDTPPDELEAITNLRDLILGGNQDDHTVDKTVEQVNVPTPKAITEFNNAQTSK